MKNFNSLLLIPATMLFSSSIIEAAPAFNQRFERIKSQAANGEKRSQYKLAQAYLRGNYIKTDIDEAIYWFEKSFKQGYIKAAHKLGMIYYFNKKGKQHYRRAFSWFGQAAQKNYAESQYYVGKLYFEGHGVKRNYERALFWLKKAEALDFLAATRDIRTIRTLLRNGGPKASTRKAAKPIAAVAKNPVSVRVEPVPFITPVSATSTRKLTNKPTNAAHPGGVGGPFRPIAKVSTPAKIPDNKPINTSEVLLSGFWQKGGKPAELMPSALNKCTFRQDIMTCMSKRLNKQTKVAQVSYKVQARYLNFKPNGTFDIKYRKKYIFVLPIDADDPNPTTTLPTTGWQRGIKKMKCRVVSNAKISCKSLKGNVSKVFHK